MKKEFKLVDMGNGESSRITMNDNLFKMGMKRSE